MSDTPASSAILLSVTQSVVVFTALLPPFTEVRKADKHDIDMRADVRLAEAAASTLVIGIGVIASSVTKSPAPAMASIVCALLLVGMYESVLNNVTPGQISETVKKGTATK